MTNNFKFRHTPVMVKEVMKFLVLKKGSILVDGTLGGGGHSAALLRKTKILNLKFQILVVAIDQDEEAIKAAKKKLLAFKDKIIFIQDNFKNLGKILDNLGIAKVDGIILDLGVSSYQFDNPKRGFSFREKDTQLDMRMDRSSQLTASEIINKYRPEELSRIFFELGEEPYARQIARNIVIHRREKKIKTAAELLDIIKSVTPPKYRYSRHHHYATKIFQALRIEVNQELEALRNVLPQAIEKLNKKGRLVVISFHSLEDRIVKHFFREQKNEGTVKILTKKPITPTREEIRLNPRARSAKLRAVERTNIKIQIPNIK